MDTTIAQALRDAYKALEPYSSTYRVDFDRYALSIRMLLELPNIHEKHVLDIGTGIGILPIALRKLGIQADGMEYFIFPESDNEMFGQKNIEAIERVWKEAGVTVIRHDITGTTPLPSSAHTDVIVSEAAIEHLKAPRRFLENARELLPQDGYILISTPNSANLLQRLRFLAGLSPNWPIEEFFKDGESFTGHWREYTLDELVYMVRKSGFTVLRAHSRNALAKFKGIRSWRKNLRALIISIGWLIPKGREMNYVLGQKK